MSQTKRLSELKPGDHMWFEGEIETIHRIEKCDTVGFYRVTFRDGSDPLLEDELLPEGDWAVPNAEGKEAEETK